MSKVGYLLLVLMASTQVARADTKTGHPAGETSSDYLLTTATPGGEVTPGTPVVVPTVEIPQKTSVSVPTITIPRPTVTPRPLAQHASSRRAKVAHQAATRKQWILAYLTSYCPGSAGWISASGQTVFYGMLANDYYPFGTHVYLPVIGITGVVLDRVGAFPTWNHFDVWSPVCYGTPTGWFHVAVLAR